jgi:hypothetical protein
MKTLQPYLGPYEITKPDTVIAGKIITAPLVIAAANVTLRDSVIYGPTSIDGDIPAILISEPGARVLNNEIRGTSASDSSLNPATGVKIWADDVTLSGNDLYWLAGDAITIDGTRVIVSGNYVHDFTAREGVHLDGIVYDQSTENSVLIQHNTALMWLPGEMSGVIALPVSGPNITVNDNLLAGGGYAIVGGGGGEDGGAGVTISHNKFATIYASGCGAYGTHAHLLDSVKWSDNRWFTPARDRQMEISR